jgi:hypothetical protein
VPSGRVAKSENYLSEIERLVEENTRITAELQDLQRREEDFFESWKI